VPTISAQQIQARYGNDGYALKQLVALSRPSRLEQTPIQPACFPIGKRLGQRRDQRCHEKKIRLPLAIIQV